MFLQKVADDCGVTLYELAKRCGIPRSSVYHFNERPAGLSGRQILAVEDYAVRHGSVYRKRATFMNAYRRVVRSSARGP